MKKTIFFLLIILINFSFAQKADSINYGGIFLNAQDYKDNKLSYSYNCESPSVKIKFNHFFSKKYIEIISGDKKTRLYKDSIFGYRDCKQKEYRFYKDYDHEYQVVENKNIIIYIADEPVTSSTGKTVNLVPHYFFSSTLNSAILPLTIINLKRAFPDNLKFHDLLDVEFYDIKTISTYDDTHKMYKINYLLSQSNN